MFRPACLAFVLFLLPTAAGAGTVTLALRGDTPPPIAVTIERPADYVALPLLLRVERDDPGQRIDAITDAIAKVEGALAGQTGLRLEIGTVSISGGQGGKFLSSGSGSGTSSTTLHLLASLSSEKDFFTQARRLHTLLAKLELPDEVELRPGKLLLGIEAREKYRPELLRAIRDHIKQVEEALDAKVRLRLNGLEAPVRVVQEGTATVQLFIPYSLDVETD